MADKFDKKTEMNEISAMFGPIQKSSSATSSALKKSFSFNGNPVKSCSRRKLHTVPSDKDESRQIEAFRKECLSKAIQWNMVDLLKGGTLFKPDDPKILNLLTNIELKKILQLTESKQQNRMFLCFLKQKSFDAMQKWLSACDLDEQTIQKVNETYSDFSSREKNEKNMKCFLCRLTLECPLSMVADHLFSADIIEDNLYKRCFTNEAPIGYQQDVWKKVVDHCRNYPQQELVFRAIKIALEDARDNDEKTIVDSESLLAEMQIFKKATEGNLICNCADKCIKSLHPLSCVKTYPSIPLYFRKQNKKTDTESSDSDPSQTTSCERLEDDDTGAEGDCESSPHSSSSLESLSQDHNVSIITTKTRKIASDSTLKLQPNLGYVQDEPILNIPDNEISKLTLDTEPVKRNGNRQLHKKTETRVPNGIFLNCDNAYFNCSNNFFSR